MTRLNTDSCFFKKIPLEPVKSETSHLHKKHIYEKLTANVIINNER